jgi:hypothetical protein
VCDTIFDAVVVSQDSPRLRRAALDEPLPQSTSKVCASDAHLLLRFPQLAEPGFGSQVDDNIVIV